MSGLSRVAMITMMAVISLLVVGSVASYIYLPRPPDSSKIEKIVIVVNPVPRDRVEADSLQDQPG